LSIKIIKIYVENYPSQYNSMMFWLLLYCVFA